jgi:hypothetical protein
LNGFVKTIKTSAMTGEGINEAFFELVKIILSI